MQQPGGVRVLGAVQHAGNLGGLLEVRPCFVVVLEVGVEQAQVVQRGEDLRVVGPQLGARDVERLQEQLLGLPITLLALIDGAEIVQARGHGRVPLAQP